MAAAVAITLYEAEESITALLDSVDLVTPELEAEFLADFEHALTTAADKRDRVAHQLAKLEDQQAFAAAEIKRLQEYKKAKEAEQTRLEGYVSYVIQRLPKDAKGKFRKLEGHTTQLFLRKSPASLDVTDESQIANDYRRVGVTFNANTFEDVLNALDDPFREKVLGELGDGFALSVDKRAVKAAIEAGAEIAGARLVTDKYNVGRK